MALFRGFLKGMVLDRENAHRPTATRCVSLGPSRSAERRDQPLPDVDPSRRPLRIGAENVCGDADSAAEAIPQMERGCPLVRTRTGFGTHASRAFRPLRLGSPCHDGRQSSACLSHPRTPYSLLGASWRIGRADTRPRWSQRRAKISVLRSIAIGEYGLPAKKRASADTVAKTGHADRFSVATKKPSVPCRAGVSRSESLRPSADSGGAEASAAAQTSAYGTIPN